MYENIISAFNNNRIIMITVWSDLKKSNILYEDILYMYLCSMQIYKDKIFDIDRIGSIKI